MADLKSNVHKLSLITLITASLFMGQALAQQQISPKYQIIAGFVLQLTSFVHWPDPRQDIVDVCIVGQDPFRGYIDQMVDARPTNRLGQQIMVRRVTLDDNINLCQLIYSAQNSIATVAKKINEKQAVLLVGNRDDFIEQGGMVNFYQQNKRMRLEINLPEVQRHQLAISSELLKLVKLTGNDNSEGRR